jgi:hypothetical protein
VSGAGQLFGEVAEWSNALDLKSSEVKISGSSNLPLSVDYIDIVVSHPISIDSVDIAHAKTHRELIT